MRRNCSELRGDLAGFAVLGRPPFVSQSPSEPSCDLTGRTNRTSRVRIQGEKFTKKFYLLTVIVIAMDLRLGLSSAQL